MIPPRGDAAIVVGPGGKVTLDPSKRRPGRYVARPPKLSEAEFAGQVDDLAAILGWVWVHFRPAQTAKGWRTPVQGPLGKGWPDRIYFRPRDGRVIAVEFKREGAKTSPEQEEVLAVFRACRLAAYVWRPDDFAEIEAVLRGDQPAAHIAIEEVRNG